MKIVISALLYVHLNYQGPCSLSFLFLEYFFFDFFFQNQVIFRVKNSIRIRILQNCHKNVLSIHIFLQTISFNILKLNVIHFLHSYIVLLKLKKFSGSENICLKINNSFKKKMYINMDPDNLNRTVLLICVLKD